MCFQNYRTVSQGGQRWPAMEMNPVIPPGNTLMQDQMNGNYCGQLPVQQPTLTWSKHDTQPNANVSSQMFYYSQPSLSSQCTVTQSISSTKTSSPGSVMSSPSKSEAECSTVSTEEMADCNDSGCDSDGTGSANGDVFKEMEEKSQSASVELEEKLDDYIAQSKDNDAGKVNCTPVTVESTHYPKQKSKRKYYMYGDLKLVKPIKDIPPRYLKLLSKLSAEKSRCEGEPIIVPYLTPKPHWNHYNAHKSGQQGPTVASNGFNPEAKAFIPSNPVIHDPSIIACGGNIINEHGVTVLPGDRASVTHIPDHATAGAGLYMFQPAAGCSNYNYNLMYSQTSMGGGNQNNSIRCSTANNGDGCVYSMPPSFSTGPAGAYPGSAQCPVYYQAPSGPCAGAQGCMPTQVPAGAYLPAQNCGILPPTMPIPSVQLAQ